MGASTSDANKRILSGMLQSGDIMSYEGTLSERYPGKFTNTNLLSAFSQSPYGRVGTDLDTIKRYITQALRQTNAPNIIMMPVVLAASRWLPLAENHVTLLILNKDKKTIEYYDPKGGDLSKEGRELAALPAGTMTGKAFLQEVRTLAKTATGADYRYQDCKPKGFWASALGFIGLSGLGRRLSSHQGAFDRISCGIFVARAIRNYLEEDASLEAVKRPLPPTFSLTQERHEIAIAVQKAASLGSRASTNPVDRRLGSTRAPQRYSPSPEEWVGPKEGAEYIPLLPRSKSKGNNLSN